jgi:hypothetical protein
VPPPTGTSLALMSSGWAVVLAADDGDASGPYDEQDVNPQRARVQAPPPMRIPRRDRTGSMIGCS